MLVPSSVNTGIAESTRNRPGALAAGMGAEDASFVEQALADLISTGAEPAHVAGLVLDAVREGRFMIPTSASYDGQVEHRAAQLLAREAPQGLTFD